MIIVEIKEGEPFDKALKKFKKKVERIRLLKEVRERMHYTKPTVKRKMARVKAKYKYKILYGGNQM